MKLFIRSLSNWISNKIWLLILFFSIQSNAQLFYNIGNGSDGVYHATTNGSIVGGTYNFTQFTIDPGVTVNVTGTAPLIIRSIGNVIIHGTLQANGGNGSNGVTSITGGIGGIGVAGGGNGGNGSFTFSNAPVNGTDGVGAGGVNNKGSNWSGGGGGGYANIGSPANISSPNGGTQYGDSMISGLPAGSGGGGGSGGNECGAGGGGAGGGLIVINSGANLIISATGGIYVNGGNGGSDGGGFCGGGAGGSGGTIWLAALTVNHTGTLNALGGIGGTAALWPPIFISGNGGNGSVGRIRVDYNTGTTNGTDNPTIGFHTNVSSIPLPATIISFEGFQKGGIDTIHWVSTLEVNTDEYILQYSKNAQDFISLAKIKSKAKNNNYGDLLMYAVSNQHPSLGHNYYRLQQKDIDEKIQLVSETIDLFRDGKDNVFTLFPNPSNGVVYFNAYFSASTEVNLCVRDMRGHLVLEKIINANPGNYQTEINIQNLPLGTYLVSIKNTAIDWNQIIIKQ